MSLEACLAMADRSTTLRPKFPDSWYNLGCLLAYVGRHTDALHAVHRALEVHPQYVDASISRCFLLVELGRHEEAFREVKRLHVRSPDDFSTLFALGIYFMRCGWNDIGVTQLLRAVALRPRLPYVLLHTAAALETVGRAAEAMDLLYRARAVVEKLGIEDLTAALPTRTSGLDVHQSWQDPYLAKTHVLLANFFTGAGNEDAAERELRGACKKLPGNHLLFWSMGRTLLGRGKREEAERWLNAQVQMDEDCPQAHLELSFLHAESRDLERAVESLRKAVALRPLYPDYHYHLGTVLLDLERVDEAIEAFRRVLRIYPGYGHAPIHLASAYLARDATGLALETLAASPCADWPEALILSARALSKSGQPLRARLALEKALATDPANSEARELLTSMATCKVESPGA